MAPNQMQKVGRPPIFAWSGIMSGPWAPVLALLGLSLALGACQTLVPSPPPPPPPPPPPIYLSGPEAGIRPDWRAAILPSDRERFERRDKAWHQGLEQARELGGSGRLEGLGDLIVPDAARPFVVPPAGHYRCRTIKLGSLSEGEGLGYVVYGWFACQIEVTPAGLKLTKLTGSQRPTGLLFPEDDRQMVFLGSMALASEPVPTSYGHRPDRDMVGILERVGEARWRLVIPWPQVESRLDLIELVPAPGRRR